MPEGSAFFFPHAFSPRSGFGAVLLGSFQALGLASFPDVQSPEAKSFNKSGMMTGGAAGVCWVWGELGRRETTKVNLISTRYFDVEHSYLFSPKGPYLSAKDLCALRLPSILLNFAIRSTFVFAHPVCLLMEGVSPSVLLAPALCPKDWPQMHARPHGSGWLTSARGGKPRQLCGGCSELLWFWCFRRTFFRKRL